MDERDDLSELEARLAARAVPALPPALRPRVLAKVQEACARPRSGRWERVDFTRFAAGTAAAVVLWLNLSMSASEGTAFQGLRAQHAAITGAAVRELVPELDEDAACAMAWRMQASGTLLPAPAVAPQAASRGTRIEQHGSEEEAPWDTH